MQSKCVRSKFANLRRDRHQLARMFGAIVLAVTPTAAAVAACDSVSGSAPPHAEAGTIDSDSSLGDDAVADAVSTSDSGIACSITATYYDSGVYLDGGDGAVDIGCIYNLPCGLPPTLQAIGCTIYLTQTDSFDAQIAAGCIIPEEAGCTEGAYTPGPGGAIGVVCADCLGGGGRRPRGLQPARMLAATTPSGAYFAKMAHEEAASVHAFQRMKQELLRFGAPASLVRAAERAAREEIRHASTMQRLARRCGARCPPVRVRHPRVRSLEAMAIENAVEGCINETFGALLMTWQAQHAPTAELRKTFSKIAEDETGHAALSGELAAWSEAQLGDRARARVARARAQAVRTLLQSTKQLENKAFEKIVGWPTAQERSLLIEKMIAALDLSA